MPAAIPAAIYAASAISGAVVNAKAAKNSAKTQASTALTTAQLQDEAGKRQLAYEQQQSDIANTNAEVNRKANYDQYVAGRQRMSGLAQRLGLPAENIPAYVPGVYTSQGIGTPGQTGQPSAPAASGGDPVLDALTKNYADLGTQPTGPGSGPTDIAYMAQKIKETGGLTPDNTKYWFGANGRIAQEIAKAAGGGAAQAPSNVRQTIGQIGAPAIAGAAPMDSPIYRAPNPYQSGSIGGLAFRG